MSLPKYRRAFSLIELIVVIAIIGILLATGAASYSQSQKKSRDAKRKSDLKQVQQALEQYYQVTGTYPNHISGQIRCTNPPFNFTTESWGATFNCTHATTGVVSVFADPLPKDPVYTTLTTDYYFYINSGAQSYVLSAKLENTGDPEYCSSTTCIADGKLPCQPPVGWYYCVKSP